jgi:hypothetical protein
LQFTFITKLLVFFTVWSIFFSFLYMNLLIFILFIISSALLVYKEKEYILRAVNKYKYSIYLLFIYLILFSMPFIVFNNYSTIAYFLLTIWSIFLSIVFLKDVNLEYFYDGIKYLLFTFIIITLIYIYYTHGMYPSAYRLDYMIGGNVSGNGPTSFLNILLGVYTALRMKLKNRSTLVISLLSLYIVIEGYGRGSILFVLIMIIINLIFIFFNLKKNWKLFFTIIFSFLLIISITFIYEFFLTTKLAQGFDSARIYIAQEYLNKMDVFGFLFGVSYENTVIANMYYNNPHITYIRAHHIFGLFYILGLFYIISKKLFYVILNYSLVNWMILLIVFNILIRAISEPLLFPSLFDSFFLVILFLITKKIQKENV